MDGTNCRNQPETNYNPQMSRSPSNGRRVALLRKKRMISCSNPEPSTTSNRRTTPARFVIREEREKTVWTTCKSTASQAPIRLVHPCTTRQAVVPPRDLFLFLVTDNWGNRTRTGWASLFSWHSARKGDVSEFDF